MDKIESQAMFQQVRVAHRMAVAYYKRLFQLLKEVTNDERLGLNFLAWDTNDFDRPCYKKGNVFESWEWDLLPGISANYVFFSGQNKNEQSEGDWLLDFHVVTDTGVISSDWNKENKDPFELSLTAEDANSVLRIHVLAACQKGELKWFEDLWLNSNDLECTDVPCIEIADDQNSLKGCGFEIALDELTGEDAADKLINRILEYRNALDKDLGVKRK